MESEEGTNQNFDPDRLVDLIKGNIAKATWEEDPAAYSARIQKGILIVKQTAAVHQQIQTLLKGLRRSSSIMVALEARFLLVEDNFLEDIGVDFRGLGDNSQGIGTAGRGTNVVMDDFGAAGSPGGVGSPENPAGPGTDARAGIFLQRQLGWRHSHPYRESLRLSPGQSQGAHRIGRPLLPADLSG